MLWGFSKGQPAASGRLIGKGPAQREDGQAGPQVGDSTTGWAACSPHTACRDGRDTTGCSCPALSSEVAEMKATGLTMGGGGQGFPQRLSAEQQEQPVARGHGATISPRRHREERRHRLGHQRCCGQAPGCHPRETEPQPSGPRVGKRSSRPLPRNQAAEPRRC